jgi:hypothetical protein
LIVLAAAALWSCFPEYSCTEIGCNTGLQCNAESGKCEELRQSCQQTGCPAGRVCDASAGVCRSEGARCVDNSCPSRQVCNAQTGFCEARSNCQIDPCVSAAEQCDAISGRCIPRTCADDSTCPSAYHCSETGECRTGCRVGADQACPRDQFCRASLGESIGQCRESCHADQDCPLGQWCQQTRDGSTCESQRCESDTDCRGEGVCLDNICHAPPCGADDDCQRNEICDLPTGTCLSADCEEDIHAPNQRLADAVELQPGSYSELRICPGKSDWFRFQMRSSDAFEFRLEHSPGVDLDIFVYDPQGYLLSANQQTGAVTTLTMLSEQTQQATVQIRSMATANASYDLRVDRNPTDIFCRDDTSEENDHPGQAVALPTDTTAPFEASLGLCGADEDWFILPGLRRDQGLVVAHSQASPGVIVDLYTPDNEIFELRRDSTDTAELRIERLGAAGDYLLRARSWLNRSGSYRLRTQLLEPFSCPQANAHNTTDSAAQLVPDDVNIFAFCPLEQGWEVDFLELPASAEAGTLTAQVVAVGDLPDLDVVLFEQTDQGLVALRSGVRSQSYYQLNAPTQADTTYMLRISANGDPGRIVDGVDYQVSYSYESSD